MLHTRTLIAEHNTRAVSDTLAQDATPSVLVLDDEAAVRETLCAMVRSCGLSAKCAATAEQFFDALHTTHFDLVIIDLQMPGCDGLEVISRLAQTETCQVIITSGSGQRILKCVQLSAEASGVNVLGILPKPLRRQHLKDLLSCAEPCKRKAQRETPPKPDLQINTHMLRDAIAKREITCFLQPKVRLGDGKVYGFEALARWLSPEHGVISPDQFVPFASENGLELDLTLSILDQSMECLGSLSDKSLSVAVNIPLRVCTDPRFDKALNTMLDVHGLLPRHIMFEVTEAGPNGIDHAELNALLRLRLRGHRLSIDDFGTGASSLERLIRIPFDELKIDRLFVRNIDKSHDARSLIRNLVQMGKLFGMTVTIEGVETPSSIHISRKLGCDNAQGYVLARPMPISTLQDWMLEHRAPETHQCTLQLH